MAVRHFLSLLDLTPNELKGLISRAHKLKTDHNAGIIDTPFKQNVLGMLFEKSSTRTRISFETAMIHLGGHAIFLLPGDMQLGRGEPVEDTARVLSRIVDIIMLRTHSHDKLDLFAQYSSVPVINGLTEKEHPCQLLADIQTYVEHRGDIGGKTIAWIGDGNNMCHSYMDAAQQFDFQLRIACPKGYEPNEQKLRHTRDRVFLTHDALIAAENADLVVTDVWASMGQEDEHTIRMQTFAPFQVNTKVMAAAKSEALFMHCLPAHRGEEVSADVLEGPQSVVWDEAENRLHSQKALLEFLLL